MKLPLTVNFAEGYMIYCGNPGFSGYGFSVFSSAGAGYPLDKFKVGREGGMRWCDGSQCLGLATICIMSRKHVMGCVC